MRKLIGLALFCVCVMSAEAAMRVPIRFNVPEGIETYSGTQPVTFGVPFTKGTFRKGDNVRVVDAAGKVVPAQFEVTATWGPKSDEVRWLLIDTLAKITRGKAAPRFIEFGEGVPRYVPDEVQLAGLKTFTRLFGGLQLTDGAGTVYRPVGQKAEVERVGPVRSVVKITGNFRKNGVAIARHVTRVWGYRNRFRVFHTLIWLTDDTTQIGAFSFVPGVEAKGVAVGGLDGSRVGPAPSLVLRQVDWNKASDSARGKQVDGWIQAGAGRSCLFVGVRWPWQQYPLALSAKGGKLRIDLIGPETPMSLHWKDISIPAVNPRQILRTDPRVVKGVRHNWWDVNVVGAGGRKGHINPRGISKTWEVALQLGAERVPPETKNILCQHPVLAYADPAFATRANLPSPVTPKDTERFPKMEAVLSRAFDWYTTERQRDGDYGTWNYGDLQWIWTGRGYTIYRYWMNNGKGWPIVPWLLWLRSGERKYLENGEANARHIMDVDICHVPETVRAKDGKIRGGIYEYSAMHWSKGPNVDYFTADSEFLPYTWYLTGYERAWDVLKERVEALARYDRTERVKYYKANPLLRTRTLYVMVKELAVLYEATWDVRIKAYLDEYLELLLDAQNKAGWLPGVKSNHYLDQPLNLALRVYGPKRILPVMAKWHRYTGDWDRPGPTGEMGGPPSLWSAVTVAEQMNDPHALKIAAACARARVWNIDEGDSSWRGMALVPAHEAGPFMRDWVTVMAALSKKGADADPSLLAPAHINARLPITGANTEKWRGRHVVLVLDEKDEAFTTRFGFLCMNFDTLKETPQRVRVIAPDGKVVSDKMYPIKVSYARQFGKHNIVVNVPADGKKGVYLFEMFTRPLALPTLARSTTGKVVHFVPPGRRSFTTSQGGWVGGGVVWFQPKGGEPVTISYPNQLAQSRTVILDAAGKLVASSRLTGTHAGGYPVGVPCKFVPGNKGLYAFNASEMNWHAMQTISGMRPYMAHFKGEWFDPEKHACPDLKAYTPMAAVATPRPAPKTRVAWPKGEGLLKNGDFEKGPAGVETRGKYPPSWPKRIGSVARVEIAKEARPGSKGTQCLRIVAGKQPHQAGVYSALTPFDPTKPLGISGWVKAVSPKTGNKGHIYFGVGWHDKDRKPALINKKTKQNYYYLGFRRNGTWQPSRAIYTRAAEVKDVYAYSEYPPNAAYFNIWCFVIGYDKAPAMWDDIEAVQ